MKMQMFSTKYMKWVLLFFVCLFLTAYSDTSVDGAAQPVQCSGNWTVKAGIFDFDGYHMKDANGNLSGYGIEFLNLVSQYSHLNFTYTGYDKSWNETLEMLESGEIDLVTSEHKTSKRQEKFAFSLPIGMSRTILSIRSDNTRLHSGNYTSYDGMTIGILAGSSQNNYLKKFAAEKGFSYHTKTYANSRMLADALQDGRIDAVLSSDLRRTENEKTLDMITSDHFYAIVRKEDTWLLDEVNYAIEQMNINEGDWSNLLFYKYYGPVYSSALSFNSRENAYIQEVLAGKKNITATASGDRKPYSYIENGELKGILPDYFAKLMELAGLPFQLVVPKDRADYYNLIDTNGVDVVIDTRTANHMAKTHSDRGFYTNTYMTAGMAKVTRKDFDGKISTVAVAEVQGNLPLEGGFIEDATILKYTTREEALQAVLDKQADAAYVYTYTAQIFVNNDFTDSLQYSIINESSFDFRMFVRKSSDHELVTILNKCIQKVPEDFTSQLIANYTSYAPKDLTFTQYITAHPELLCVIISVSILVAGIIIALFRKTRWNQKILYATETSKRELEEQFAIVDALSRDYINIFSINLKEGLSKVVKIRSYTSEILNLSHEEEFEYAAVAQTYIQKNVHPDDKADLARAVSLETVKEKLDSANEYIGSFRSLIDGATHNYQFTFVKVTADSLYKDNYVLAGFRNIDEMVRKEQEQKHALKEALAEAQHANHAKTTFLNNMSHDIRTPMNAIIGFTSLASTHIDNREQVQNYLGKIMTSSRHLLSLINDVLDMSRIESGKVKIEEKEASLAEIMHDLKTIVQSDVKAKQFTFHINTVDVTNETIICDKLRLNQVLLNILSNAMKYTKPGGTVSVRIVQTDHALEGYASYEFHIKDTGIGMSSHFLEHLFEPFEREQTSTISGIQGTGLGLAITKNIVDMMNGQIHVQSEEGVGTEFIVSFSFRTVKNPAQIECPPELANKRALIVDDDINTCTSVSKMLSLIGMHPDWTTQGKEAVVRTEFALEQKEPYSVYLIDWLMPDLNGIEIVRRIRKVIGTLPTIVILTAYDWTDIEEEAKEAGVTSFCSKPIFLSELHQVLTAPFSACKTPVEEPAPEELFTGRHILLVEDNEINQEIAKAILEESGFSIDIANDGTVAVDTMKQMPADTYDLILMDIQMAVMNGYDAARAIRALEDPVKSAIPIVAMTANAFEEDKQLALDAGMNGHVAKPIDVSQLMETLQKILHSKGV